MTRAFVAFGSNLGNRLNNLQRAAQMLQDWPGIRILRASSIYETDPVGPVDQPRFLNAVAEIETDIPPQALLKVLISIERNLGRDRSEGLRWGPRLIDLDLLLYGDLEVNEPQRFGLMLPHPRMHERLFVLIPLTDIAPERVIQSNVDALKRESQETRDRVDRVEDAQLIHISEGEP